MKQIQLAVLENPLYYEVLYSLSRPIYLIHKYMFMCIYIGLLNNKMQDA